ncbi:MAG: hypothetical protein LAO78_01970 [Acidobacteriia bacterium]|nr:hypothetical protein [Terriglobia bacterium]
MAVNKAKRSIHLAQHQPQSQPTQPLPVRAHAYRCLAEMNNGFEQALHGLEELKKVNCFSSSESLHGIYNLLSRLRAQANREAMAVLAERETANARHFQQHCLETERAS